MNAMSRNKGASFEREIARDLEALTGVSFKRNLEQVRAEAQADLNPDDPAFPFVIECKRRAAGKACPDAWKAQATAAAQAAGKLPAVVFRFDRQPTRVVVPLSALGGCDGEWAEVTLTGFASICAEIMAGKVL